MIVRPGDAEHDAPLPFDPAVDQAGLGCPGLATLPTFIAGCELQAGRLVEVLPGYVLVECFIYAVHLPNWHLPLNLRAFIDYLQQHFGEEAYWDRPPAPGEERLWLGRSR